MLNYKLTGIDSIAKHVQENVQRTFNTQIEGIVKDYLEKQIDLQLDAENKSMPEKASSTKKLYAKHGWNQDKFLVRTGASTKLKSIRSGNVIIVQPEGSDILKNLIPRRTTWMVLNEQAVTQITNKFLEQLKKDLG